MITQIFNSGAYPEVFKRALVVPINKSGDLTNIMDYRPISILPVFNKIVEKTVHRQVTCFLDKNNFLYNRQYGFRERCSTESAATELIEHVHKEIDKGLKVSMVRMDLSKAFDLVDHSLLIDCMQDSGIRGIALDLFSNYLMNRFQTVKIGSIFSSQKQVNTGIVQGSVLGPMMFNIFINNLAQLPLNGIPFLYADDIVLVNSHEAREDERSKINDDMTLIYNRLTEKRLILNYDKSFYMMLSSPNKKLHLKDVLSLDFGLTLKRVDNLKYLGLIIDQNLKWDKHIDHTASKLADTTGILWKMRKRLPVKVKRSIYHTLIESRISYMSLIWGSASETAIKQIQTVQNRALCNVFEIDRLESRVTMYTHKVEACLPIRALCYVSIATHMYKILNYKSRSNICFDRRPDSARQFRRSFDLRPTTGRTNFGRRAITAMGVRIYNSIPLEIRALKSQYSFKWALKCYIRREDFIVDCFSNNFLASYG
jgi:hypothetical protein